jgi:enoyl-CoA hydratase
MSTLEYIKKRMEDSALVLTIDNPPVNVLNLKLLDELVSEVSSGAQDPAVRGIVITGAGNNAFCAGADLKMMTSFGPGDIDSLVTAGQRAFSSVELCPKPVIAAINGLTLGGGNELAMSCDLRFASDRARFGQTEVNVGLIPAWGGTQRMSRLIGVAKAKELIFSGQIINAQEALKVGLVNKVVPDGEELRASIDFVRMLAGKTSPVAVREAKIAINKGLREASIDDGMKHELEGLKNVAKSEDLQEGIAAFLEKRPPKYSGK